jgi:hypothetical protein
MVLDLSHPFTQSVVLPFAVTVIGVGLSQLALSDHARDAVTGSALALAMLLAYVAMLGLPPLPPRSAVQRLGVLIALALAFGPLLDLLRLPTPLVRGLVILLPIAGLFWLGLPVLQTREVADLALGATVLAAGLVLMIRAVQLRDRPQDAGLLLAAAAAGVGLIALLGASTSVAQLALAVAAAAAGYLLWNWPRPRQRLGAAAALAGYGILAAVVGQAAWFTDAPCYALLALVPVLFADVALNRLAPAGRSSGAWGAPILAAVYAVLVAGAAGVALLSGGSTPYG